MIQKKHQPCIYSNVKYLGISLSIILSLDIRDTRQQINSVVKLHRLNSYFR